MPSFKLSLGFDMRSPEWATPTRDLYRAALEMGAFADRIGIDSLGMMEHHASEDGYLPQPFVLAGGMAAVTRRIRLNLGAVLLPLHDPVMLAEKIAVLDLVSNGRMNVIFGAGYVAEEFAMFGKSMKDRARLMDEGIEIVLRALRGERFEFNGRPIFVRPLPIQEPEDIIMVGGGVPASALRAGRFGVGFGPMVPELVDIYLAECEKHGHRPRNYFRQPRNVPMSIHLSEDPDAGWKAIAPHAIHVITQYAKFAEGTTANSRFKGLNDPSVLRESGLFVSWTPEMLLDHVRSRTSGTVQFWPLVGGLDPDEAWKSLRLLEQLMPEIEAIREPQ